MVIRYVPVSPARTTLAPPPPVRRLSFTPAEWRRLFALYGVIATLHIVGWGLFLYYAARFPSLVGLGFVAYMFGLRHAFDADHIAAVDDTVRLLMQNGRDALGVGFWFSLGHSSVVFVLAVAIALASALVKEALPGLKELGGLIGASVSATFLLLVGILNLLVLLDVLKLWRTARSGRHSHTHIDELLQQRGLMNRLFGGRLRRAIRHSAQMFPLGVLFGLGFDTASEIGLLAMTAGAATADLPLAAVLSLPVLFAAGMTVMDTTDGVLMTKAYNWSLVNPLRRIFYNIATTSLSVAIALLIGAIEALQVLRSVFDLQGPFFDFIGELTFGVLGYVIVGIFLITWASAAALWHFGRRGEREAAAMEAHAHEHVHSGGIRHSHKHLH